jgi:hypothetical protein
LRHHCFDPGAAAEYKSLVKQGHPVGCENRDRGGTRDGAWLVC